MRAKITASILLPLFLSLQAAAQLYTVGDDPGSTRWNSVTTNDFKLIYPSGLDSLAGSYARSLEKLSSTVSLTIGCKPNCNYRKPMPAILHTQTSYSNGVVTWCPRRVDFLTVPDPYNPLPMKWEDQLVVHELRHVAQMQFGRDRHYEWLYYVTGEFWSGALAAIYPGQAFLEGDAVVAETEFSQSGRGRSASFLEYYKASFLAGERRDFWKWRYGSEKFYTPDHYRAGYLMIAGPRYLYDEPLFTQKYFDRIRRYGLPFWNFDKTVKEVSGGSNLRKTFAAMTDTLTTMWTSDSAARAPFMPVEVLTRPSRLFTEYTRNLVIGSDIYSIRSGIDASASLVRIDTTGKVTNLGAFSSGTSRLAANPLPARFYWTELRVDPRWSLRNSSVVRYRDAEGNIRDLTGTGRRLFNPSVNADGTLLSVTEYLADGQSALVVMDPFSGESITKKMPHGLQITETAWENDSSIIAVGIDGEGAGLYRISEKGLSVVLAPQHACLKSLTAGPERHIHFISDLNGTDELYRIGDGDEIFRVTNTLMGISSPAFSEDGYLYYSSLRKDGRMLCRTAVKDLPVSKADFSERAKWPIADKLSAQMESLPLPDADTLVSEPSRYVKAAHLFKFHSWIPVYAEYDAISSMSMETIQKKAGLGAMAFFQNELGTMSGYVGYNAWTPGLGWRNYLHASFTYSGLYPVFEGQFNVGKENSASLRTYIPFNFSSGGWQRGVIPQAKVFVGPDGFGWSAALRAYTMRPTAPSGLYPRVGVGAEVLYGSSTKAASLYCYLPGILRTHGIKATTVVQQLSEYNASQTAVYYALPIANLDWSFMCPVFYVKNLELTAKYVYTYLWNEKGRGNYSTVGGSLALHLANLAFVPFDTRIGLGYECCPTLEKKHYFNLVFSIDL